MPMVAAATRAHRRATVTARVERWLRVVGDPRVGLGLLLLAGAANALAAAVPAARGGLDSLPYLLLVGAIALSGAAAVAVRLPGVRREWRRPGALAPHPTDWSAVLRGAPSSEQLHRLVAELRGAGYRVREQQGRRRWAVHGVKRGWARFAGLASHLALVVMVVGAALGTAFSEETVFGLFPGEQSLLGQPRPGLTASVRLDAFDADFGANGLPTKLDTSVTFVRDGRAVRSQVLRVNEPGAFDGYLVHGWTYGPAAQIRVTDLGGRPLADTPVALGGSPTSQRAPFVEVPTLGLTLGLELVDAAANEGRHRRQQLRRRRPRGVAPRPGGATRIGRRAHDRPDRLRHLRQPQRSGPAAAVLRSRPIVCVTGCRPVAPPAAAQSDPRRTAAAPRLPWRTVRHSEGRVRPHAQPHRARTGCRG
jgi:hypothetical protein